jgi:N-acetylglucosaminyl-diphospho-decaprenol L-rhamnosyltransferase
VKVVAIVVSYNSAADLPTSLGCIQELSICRAIVVDNASSDRSVEVALGYTDLVMRMENVGFGSAINRAAEVAPDADASG